MERFVLLEGDCLETLKGLGDNSVDSVVTDPPYEIGFMGKAWDGSGVAYNVQLWRECLRVLKPGGHLLAFGATRSYHRMAVAIEDAGFEIRDSIHWTYGCLTDDVDVLTPDGWKRGTDITTGDTIAQWDPADGTITLTPVLDTYRAPWNGPLVRFHSTDTDQLLTPNHRVYHQVRVHRSTGGTAYHEWSEWRVKEAADISRAGDLRLPVAGWHDGPGIGGTDYAALLGWVWTEGHFDANGTGVRVYQSSVKQDLCDEIAALMDRVGPHKRYDRGRTYTRRNGTPHTYTESTWFFTGDLAQRVRADLPGKHPTFDLLWRMSQAEKEAFLAAALAGDGSRSAGGSWSLEQKDPTDREWFVSLLALVGRRGHNYTRTAREGGSVSVSQRPATQVSRRALADASADYSGDVWCVRVATGAFVARRNGQVFVTGNSGFPKSHNVGKAIDKAAGAVREVVSPRTGFSGAFKQDGPSAKDRSGGLFSGNVEITAPATDAAKQWEGWGTALKPSHEPIVVARKPLAGTVAANVLEYGTGALNIGATRVGTEIMEKTTSDGVIKSQNRSMSGGNPARVSAGHATGRWPANTILTHAAGCVQVGEADVKGGDPNRFAKTDGGTFAAFSKSAPVVRTGNPDGTETTPVFQCVEGCPVAALDGQSGTTKSTARTGKRSGKSSERYGAFAGQDSADMGHNDAGGASRYFTQTVWDPEWDAPFKYVPKPSRKERDAGLEGLPEKQKVFNGKSDKPAGRAPGSVEDKFTTAPATNNHPTVKPVALMRYLCRLVTPPGGTVLDPFLGSGTTAVAAVLEGFHVIGCEMTPDYFPIIQARVAHAQQTVDGQLFSG